MSFEWRRITLFCGIVCFLLASGRAAEPRLLGSQSCGTSTCHGGTIGGGPPWHFSMSTWIAKDPHAGAGLLLKDQDSRQIVLRLDPSSAESPEAYDNVLRERCISCHMTAAAGETIARGELSNAELAVGVSCESCHGAAESWLEKHIRADWHGVKRFASPIGMRDTESIVGRGETCVRCHVGSRSADGMVRDMNHDLIAAGHPALRFDLLLYSENLPRHWDVGSDAEVTFNQSAIRVRDVGRAVNLAASLELSTERAVDHLNQAASGGPTGHSVPWPEFADYDCFSCHQALKFRRAETEFVSSGVPVWNTWSSLRQRDISPELMSQLSIAKRDPGPLSKLLPIKTLEWRGKAIDLARAEIDPSERLNEIRVELSQKPKLKRLTWSQAAIQYLQLDAVQRDLAKNPADAARAALMADQLVEIERLLRFDPDRTRNQPGRYHSPSQFDANQFREAVDAMLQSTASSSESARNIQLPLSRSVASQP